ncbi:glycoside hydrolase [Westerdykella ornata]|uniref:Glycoside hydrolase n=1 Tax=Westerdykella ornata TaxID=318751 RepID=A0A6A6JKT3_WESOR|nr:glycoside hydrolase [Westerdykella ornata]KAF2277127.1 glycoside hydrolase [Westerdykella ornata]
MRSSTLLVALTSAAIPAVQAHGHVSGVTVNGKWTPGSDPSWYYLPADQRKDSAGWNALNQDNGFVEPNSMGTADVNCHKAATPGKLYIDANAGDAVTFYWNTWPDTHKGPIINYIAPCDGDCTTKSPSSLRWSKISQGAYNGKTWVTDDLVKNNFTSTATIPRNLKAGNYVIRHEIIALHSAQSPNGAQLYPQCLNLRVGGSGSVAPTSGVPGTSLYKKDEAGIVFNLYTSFTTYPIPGPALWTAAN